ncbi:pentatricopeptide repeat-containing protein At2g13600-like [Mercurialis annua]|uniref:pentatricopeptide repeat-containing protein At2g13600-like n=1 Tax=Mercurialis annua TaxID=3986 RepID=UPI002160FB5C|nr:pentatricopeptide repeat-containing protein At2g13600-like [Mercurialis annua]
MHRAGHVNTITTTTHQQFYINFLCKSLETCNLLHAKSIHANLIKASIPSSIYLSNHLLNFYVKFGDLNYGLKLFDQMRERNVVSWSSVISGFVQHGCSSQALSLFSGMHRESMVSPNAFTLVSALRACSLSEDLKDLYQIYALIIRLGFESNVFVVNAFLTGLIRHEKLLEAKQVFNECLNKDIVTWNAMMAGLLQLSCLELPSFLYRMCYDGLKPDHFTFATIFTGLAADISDIRLGLQVHGRLIKSGHGADVCVGNSLLDMYLKNRRMVDGGKAFDELSIKNKRSWTQMAAGFLEYGEPRKALELFVEMTQTGMEHNNFTLATALNACANLPSVEDGKKIHGLRVKFGSEVDVCVDNALLDMYAKSGCMKEAEIVFRMMPCRSVVSWTSMIIGYAHNGQAREALEIFDEMRMENIEPNYITFIVVLYACSQGGLIDEGWKYFLSMSSDYGISPGEDHYVCMVNLLGRAGHIKEAKELILRMPFKPGVLVWQTLVGACQLHGDLETGKLAAERAMHFDTLSYSTYVTLSNMFADLKNWDSVGMLRNLMENRAVKKVPGSSWIEVGV